MLRYQPVIRNKIVCIMSLQVSYRVGTRTTGVTTAPTIGHRGVSYFCKHTEVQSMEESLIFIIVVHKGWRTRELYVLSKMPFVTICLSKLLSCAGDLSSDFGHSWHVSQKSNMFYNFGHE